MKILITGNKGLAQALGNEYSSHSVTLVSRSNGYDIAEINSWGHEFLDYDLVFNNAYSEFSQVRVLEFFYQHWRNDTTKTIVNIGSRCISYPRSESVTDYWPYRIHKRCLQQVCDEMQPGAQCTIKIFNPGPIDTDMVQHLDIPKVSPYVLARSIAMWTADPLIKRVDCWL